ncbi:hypothetical protein PAESOLCIP111_01604 [Paenibacillus solanacearum]|uniref:DUF1800 domain-containing protein n=1 Tax=Paenibacillus solanacearum TaxID=2048548 RepID=A0A916JXK5_9BACL|nr:DUF1800 domain-containing protein [Paenibacillus solanacearum]CAG7613436.1 hypothetical protein PAESOLCIP111_01604 [Paenibacillus solanacearum]
MGAQWTEQEAAHLLSRATFFPGKAEVSASLELGREETVRRLIAGESLTGKEENLTPFKELKADGKNLVGDQIVDQQTYWLYRMVNTEAPLIEKMTLFWHGHFATSYQKVREIPLILRQNDLFRKHATGDFRALVEAVGKDPAMMLYLDTNNNKKGKPNENYAREVMELFTLGVGNYTEDDIKEAARSLTGWVYDKKTDTISFNSKQHDTGKKTILGETGNFDETDVVDVLFKQEALPRFVAMKLLTYFASERPSAEWIWEIADVFAQTHHIGETLNYLFLSDAFYSLEHRGAMIKTPADYVAGILKAFNLPMAKGFAQSMRKMGQELFLPPDVAGWRGGTTWLMTTNLLARYQFAESVAKRINGNVLNSKTFLLSDQAEPQQWVAHFASQAGIPLLGERSINVLSSYAEETFVHSKQKVNGMRGLLQLIMISPDAQMK